MGNIFRVSHILQLTSRIFSTKNTSQKYLGLTINEQLDWDLYFSQLKKKLNRGIGLLAKIRHFTPKHLLKTLYFSLFNSNLIYGCQIWGQDQNEEFKKIEKLQEKAISIISFLPLILSAPISQNGQTHSNNSSANCRRIV